MKKFRAIILSAIIVIIFLSCKDLKKNNPYDPSGTAYSGVTYKGQIWYPDNADISSMITLSGRLVLAGYNPIDGYCVMKMTGDTTYYAIGGTGDAAGYFRFINDICSDDSGNIYAVDNKAMVQTISPSNIMGSWAITSTAGIDNLSIECLNSSIFISNNLDRTVTKYTLSGVFVDTLSLSATSYGSFVPGRIFRSAGSLYVVNAINKRIVVKLSDTLVDSGEYEFQDSIVDGAMAGQQMQMAASQAVYKVDQGLGLTLKWGNFGVGPGRVLNGKLVAYDSSTDSVYVLDGLTIKKFGE